MEEIGKQIPDRDVDILIYTPEELDRLSDRPFIARVLKEGLKIYESSEEPT